MFSSPASHVYSYENAENTVMKKPGNSVLARKPFIDRRVNEETPKTDKFSKPKLQLKFKEAIPEKTGDEILDTYFYNEYNDNNHIEYYPKKEDILHVLKSYCNFSNKDSNSSIIENCSFNNSYEEMDSEFDFHGSFDVEDDKKVPFIIPLDIEDIPPSLDFDFEF